MSIGNELLLQEELREKEALIQSQEKKQEVSLPQSVMWEKIPGRRLYLKFVSHEVKFTVGSLARGSQAGQVVKLY